MNSIFRYRVPATPGVHNIAMQVGAAPISVAANGYMVDIWAIIDPSKPLDVRLFHFIETAMPVMAEVGAMWGFLGTVTFLDGRDELHVFHE